MIISESIKEKLPIKDLNNYYVVTDFDRTITNGSSKTSWSILSESNMVPKVYVTERQELYDKYRPIELDNNMNFDERSKLVSEWYKKHIELFIKYHISEELFEKAGSDLRVMDLRPGAKEFLKFLKDQNIPLIIISAGIGNFIESFLKKNDCLYDNIYISSNKIIFKDGVAVGVSENIIHSLNKNEVSLPSYVKEKIKDRNKSILFGDQISDLNMVDGKKKEVIKIGFYSSRTKNTLEEFSNNYDIVCYDSDNYSELLRKLFQIL